MIITFCLLSSFSFMSRKEHITQLIWAIEDTHPKAQQCWRYNQHMTPTSAQCLVYMIIFSPFTLFLSLFNPSAAHSSSRSSFFIVLSMMPIYLRQYSFFFFFLTFLTWMYMHISLYMGMYLLNLAILDWIGVGWPGLCIIYYIGM